MCQKDNALSFGEKQIFSSKSDIYVFQILCQKIKRHKNNANPKQFLVGRQIMTSENMSHLSFKWRE